MPDRIAGSMAEMVERVAEAIWRVRYAKDLFPWEENTSEPEKNFFRAEARAAIAAMREPTEAMEAAGYEASDDYTDNDSAGRWRAMIDAALKDGRDA